MEGLGFLLSHVELLKILSRTITWSHICIWDSKLWQQKENWSGARRGREVSQRSVVGVQGGKDESASTYA